MCRKIFSVLFSFSILLSPISHSAFASETPGSISALSAVLMCADNGRVLFGKDEHRHRPMASTTKIMTALLTLEAAQSGDLPVTITNKMVPVEGSSMYLKPGDILPLSSLAKGMLAISGNDAAHSAAVALGGSVQHFTDMMNEKAHQIGMKHTIFVTPSGLDCGDHHSTAYDMALLGSYAMENKAFFDICSRRRVEVPFIEPNEIRTFFNSNRLLKRYDGCVGIKTGFTKHSGRCLVSCAERDGTRLVVVTLNAGDDWNDHEKLLDYGFSRLETVRFNDNGDIRVPVVGGVCDELFLFARESVNVTIDKGEKKHITRSVMLPPFVYAPIQDGQVVGKVEYRLHGDLVASNDLLAEKSLDYHYEKTGFINRALGFVRSLAAKCSA